MRTIAPCVFAALVLTAAHADVLPLDVDDDPVTLDYSGADLSVPTIPCPDSAIPPFRCSAYVVDFTATGTDALFSLPQNPGNDSIWAIAGPAAGFPGFIFDMSKSGLLSIPTYKGEQIRLIVDHPEPYDYWNPVPVDPVPAPIPASPVPEPGTFGLAGIGAGLCFLGRSLTRRTK